MVLERRDSGRDAAVDRGAHERPVGAHVLREQHVGGGAGRVDPLPASDRAARPGERADREPVPAGQHLAVDRGRFLGPAPGRIQRVVPALDAAPADRALRVLGRREPARHPPQGPREEGDDARGDVLVPGARVGVEEQGVVVEHPLVVRLGPVSARGVAEEAALERIAQGGYGHRVERAPDERGGRRRALGRERAGGRERVEQQHHGRDGELGRGSEPAVLRVLERGELGGDPVERGGVGERRRDGSALGGLPDRGAQLPRTLLDLVAPGGPGVGDGVEHLAERRVPGARLGRRVGARVEGAALGRREDVERPAELIREGAGRGDEGRIDLRVLLAVDLDRDEPLVQTRGERRIRERLARHDVAPVAGRVADRDEHGHVAAAGLRERLLAPRPPVDRVVRVAQEVGADGVGEAVGHASTLRAGRGADPGVRSSRACGRCRRARRSRRASARGRRGSPSPSAAPA